MIITSTGPTLAHALANFGMACVKANQEPVVMPMVTRTDSGRPDAPNIYRVTATTDRAPRLYPSDPYWARQDSPEAGSGPTDPPHGAPGAEHGAPEGPNPPGQVHEQVTIEQAIAHADHDQPHTRACGARNHEHGPDCHSTCPTCHGNY